MDKDWDVDALAGSTEDAYSYDRYRSWRACVRLLKDRGWSGREAEAFLRSKHMRWCADSYGGSYGTASSATLRRYLGTRDWTKELEELVAGTFPA